MEAGTEKTLCFEEEQKMKWWLEEDVWEREDLSFLKIWAIITCIFMGIIQERSHNHESEKSVERK